MVGVAIVPAGRVLESSAGAGLLAILTETVGGTLMLNELAEARVDLPSFRHLPSAVSTPLISTTISIPALSRR